MLAWWTLYTDEKIIHTYGHIGNTKCGTDGRLEVFGKFKGQKLKISYSIPQMDRTVSDLKSNVLVISTTFTTKFDKNTNHHVLGTQFI